MTSLTLGSLRRDRSSTLRALRPCCINDLWLRLDCRICRPRKRSETTTATLLASDARSARLMDDMTILALAPRTAIRKRTAQRSAVRSIAWLGVAVGVTCDFARGQIEHETFSALVGDQKYVAAAFQGRYEH